MPVINPVKIWKNKNFFIWGDSGQIRRTCGKWEKCVQLVEFRLKLAGELYLVVEKS
jgi:hypothetical protein